MKNLTIKKIFLVLAICLVASSINAQTKRNKPKPLATPPVITGAEIISQSGDYVEPEPTPAEKPAVKPATTNAARIKELNDRLKKLESGQTNDYDDRQKRILMNLDILTRAEQRADSLRKQLFEMIERESTIKTRLDQIENDMRSESIERTLQLSGSMRPEEVRENRRKSLTAEKANLQSLLLQVQSTRANLELNLQRAEQMVERLRLKAEKDIDDSLQIDEKQTKTELPPENQ
jgi:hypothetical protein